MLLHCSIAALLPEISLSSKMRYHSTSQGVESGPCCCRVTWEVPEDGQPAQGQSHTPSPALQPARRSRSSQEAACEAQSDSQGEQAPLSQRLQSRSSLRGSSKRLSMGSGARTAQQVDAEGGRLVTGQAEAQLLSCLLVLPLGVPDPAMGGWCNLP